MEVDLEDEDRVVWNNYSEMISDIVAYVKTTHNKIVINDNPLKLRVGYRCVTHGKSWEISLSNFKKFVDAKQIIGSDKLSQIKTLTQELISVEGRQKVADEINALANC
jgi:hypothetical protein